MFDGGLVAVGGVDDVGVAKVVTDAPTWQQVDRELRTLAKDRGALDAREAPLLRLVVRMDVWKYVAKVSLYSYVEDVLGYGPKVARDRVRVAFALEQLPLLSAALANGEHSYTAVRELTRVVVPETEAEWLDAVRDCNSARVQELVSMHRRGDRPTDPPDVDARLCPITFEVAPSIVGRLREYQRKLGDELGDVVDDTILFDALLASAESAGDGTAPRAQVQLTVCEHCDQGFVDVGGRRVPVDGGERDLLECDAVRIGSDRQPARATKDVTPATRRAVWHRDHNRCVVPGCRSTRHVDIHHVVPRAAGGGHGPDNLVLLCAGHHRLHHAGKIALDRPLANTSRPRVGAMPPLQTRSSRDVTLDPPMENVGQPRAGAMPPTQTRSSRDATVDRPMENVGQPHAGAMPPIQTRSSRDATLDRPMENVGQPRAGSMPPMQTRSLRDVTLDRPIANEHALRSVEAVGHGDVTLDRPLASASQPRAGSMQTMQTRSSREVTLDRPIDSRPERAQPSAPAKRLRVERTARVPAPEARHSHLDDRHVTSHPREVSAFAAMKADATQALVQLGFKRSEARSMVEQVSSTTTADVELTQFITAALRVPPIAK